MTKRVFTREQDQEVARLYGEGLSSIKLAEHFGVNKSSILGALKRQGVRRRRSKEKPTTQDVVIGMKDDSRILLTPSEAEQVYKIYQAGFSLNQISMAYGFGKNGRGVSASLKRYGHKLRGGKALTKEQESEAIKLYQEGLSSTQVSEQLELSDHLIKRAIGRSGLARKRTIVYKHTLNYDIFDTIDTEQKAYWLGFIYAEGSVTNDKLFSIGISIKDLCHLEKLKEFLGATQKISYRDTQSFGGKITKTVCLQINRSHMALALQKLGIIKGRGEAWRIGRFVPDSLHRHFIRGFLDGDGCLRTKPSVTFIGQRDILEWIIEVFHKNLGTNAALAVSKTKSEKVFTINYTGINQCMTITLWLYKDATIWLERKKERVGVWK